jgi:hypothetical protein
MGSMLAVGCCGFEDREGLERLIESCYRTVDLFFYVDGAFTNYNTTHYTSMDGSLELADRYPNVIAGTVSALETEKRQMYLTLSKWYGIDTLIIADTDE